MAKTQAAATREALLDVAIEALTDLSAAKLLSAVGPKVIAANAGVSTATLYHHFGTIESFADAVVERVFDLTRFPIPTVVDEIGKTYRAEFPVSAALAGHRAEFARLSGDPEMPVRIGLWALASGDVGETYAAFLNEVDRRVAQSMQALFASWGRSLRPPFTVESFVAAETAMLQGAAVRHLVDREALDADTFARAALGLITLALRVPEDERTSDDLLAEINFYPSKRPRSAASATDDPSRRRMLAAAERLFAQGHVERVTAAQIARAAAVSTSTFYNHFDGVDDVAVSVLRAQAAASLGASEPPASTREAALDVVRFVAERAILLAPYLRSLATGPAPFDDALVAHVAASLPGDGWARAEMQVLAVARTVQAHPADSPDEVVATLERLGLRIDG